MNMNREKFLEPIVLKKVVFPSLAGPALLLALLLSPAVAADDTVGQDGTVQGKGELLDRVVAIVNDDVITEQELASEVALIKGQLRAQNTRIPPDDVLKQQILDRMVLRHIQLQLAKRRTSVSMTKPSIAPWKASPGRTT